MEFPLPKPPLGEPWGDEVALDRAPTAEQVRDVMAYLVEQQSAAVALRDRVSAKRLHDMVTTVASLDLRVTPYPS